MNGIFKIIKDVFSWLWKPAYTSEEKTIKRYEALIALCIIFMVGYIGVYLTKLESKIEKNDVRIVNIDSTDPNANPAIYFSSEDTSLHPFYPTNTLTSNEFYIGEIVGIKYFGIFGIVRDKSLGINGYVYTIRYENGEHDLMSNTCYSWELYRPAPGSVPISVLRE